VIEIYHQNNLHHQKRHQMKQVAYFEQKPNLVDDHDQVKMVYEMDI
jgi:hypothetical protein